MKRYERVGYRVADYDHGVYESQIFDDIADAMAHGYSRNASRFAVIRLTKRVYSADEFEKLSPGQQQFQKIFPIRGCVVARVNRD